MKSKGDLRLKAIAYVLKNEYGYKRKDTAEYLGIVPSTLDSWLKDAKIAGLENELQKARNELRSLGNSSQSLIDEDIIDIGE